MKTRKQEVTNVIQHIQMYVKKVIDKLNGAERNIEDIIAEINDLKTIVLRLKNLIDDDIYDTYSDFFASICVLFDKCSEHDFFNDNIGTLKSSLLLFFECIDEIKETINSIYKKCACCGESVRYMSPSDIYTEQSKTNRCIGEKSETINTKEYTCPCCGASDRDRMIVSYLEKNHMQRAREGYKVLHFAPAKAIEAWILSRCPHVEYQSTDLFMDGVTFKSDIQDMNMVEDKAFDLIICSHVLEHVKDDKCALKELNRILKDDGKIVFLAAVDLNSDVIDEEWGCSEEEKLRRLKSTFCVQELGKTYFGEDVFYDCGLIDTSVLYILTKNNHVSLDMQCDIEIDDEIITNGPLVTVLLSAYNHEDFVADTIESVINQTYRNIEFIVADDGSPDNTAEVIKRYEDKCSKVLYFKENAGSRYGEIRDLATGDYIALIHSDDVWDKDKLAIQMTYLVKHPECGACLSWCDYTDENLNPEADVSVFYQKNRTSGEWIRFFWENGNALCNPSSVMKREYRISNMKYGSDCWQVPDLFKWIDTVQKTQIHIVPRTLVKMRRYNTKMRANVSCVSAETTIRHSFECGTHWLFCIRDMSKDLFVDSFGDLFVNKDASSDEEIICEKFFLLKSSDNPFIQNSAFYFLTEQYSKIENCMKEKYHYWLKEIKNDVADLQVAQIYTDLLEGK